MSALERLEPPDEEVVDRVQRGEGELFLTIFDRHYSRVERYANGLLRDREAARDIASETFLRAFRSVDRYRADSGLTYAAYLFMIARRLALNEMERRGKAPTVPFEVAALSEGETAGNTIHLPFQNVLDEERRRMVQDALDVLPTDDREIISLAFERDLSREEMRVIMGKPSVSAVTSHLYRAMRRLRQVLIRQAYFVAESEPERG